MNYLLGRNEEENPDGRPNGSEILAANNVIQELYKQNDVLKMEVEWLKKQLSLSKKEYSDRDDELKRLRFLVYLNRSRNDGLRNTLKMALEQIDSLPPPPMKKNENDENKEEKEEEKDQLIKLEDKLLSEDSFSTYETQSQNTNDHHEIKSNSNQSINPQIKNNLEITPQKTQQKAPFVNSLNSPENHHRTTPENEMVQVIENGRVISVQSELATKLERQRLLSSDKKKSPSFVFDRQNGEFRQKNEREDEKEGNILNKKKLEFDSSMNGVDSNNMNEKNKEDQQRTPEKTTLPHQPHQEVEEEQHNQSNLLNSELSPVSENYQTTSDARQHRKRDATPYLTSSEEEEEEEDQDDSYEMDHQRSSNLHSPLASRVTTRIQASTTSNSDIMSDDDLNMIEDQQTNVSTITHPSEETGRISSEVLQNSHQVEQQVEHQVEEKTHSVDIWSRLGMAP
mmetsp:Transcript_24077/g.28307  ORF Transcript_24077/g.28307 Transcript_24077/m.28307 type:complete len:454 (+) Transcript_24077:42-1403(+)